MTSRRPASPRPGRRPAFGKTWWGAAWVGALEQRAQLDPNRLPRGRSYARWGRVGELDVGPGVVSAEVRGSQSTPYTVRVRVRPFTGAQWDVVLGAIAARAAHAAALLDGELAPEILDDVGGAGIDLLPGPGEVGPTCTCPDWANPCKHAAAVCYLVADVLDGDPFALLLLRGRSREEVLAGLRRLRAGKAPPSRPAAATTEDPGVEGRAAYATHLARPPGIRDLPAVPAPPPRPGRPVVLAVDPPPASGLRREDLTELAADAARRAWELCTGEGDGGLGLTLEADLARRAEARLGPGGRGPGTGPASGTAAKGAAAGAHGAPGGLEDLAACSGIAPRELFRLGVAWRSGGAAAVEVLGSPVAVDTDAAEEGRAALTSVLGGTSRVRVQANRVTGGGIQLRLGADSRWYRFEKVRGAWELVGLPDPDPARLLAAGGLRPNPEPV